MKQVLGSGLGQRKRWLIGYSLFWLGYCPLLAAPGLAQLTPDTSLGAESSVVTPAFLQGLPTSLIGGGAPRGANLFHSFTDFNVNTGQRVYFANPVGIENILTRVTGSNVSSINGLLGVSGNANLFLLNPNGVILGPDARLDISGSFTVSTANSFAFADGSTFSALPTGGELLTVSVPLGVQFNTPQGDITSTGILETGQDLTLAGNNLYLEGQLLTGGDLTLQAADTVTIRDTAAEAFVANTGGNLTIQGNQGIDIWTLQHLDQTPFVSGGDLTLISDGVISTDAHFTGGGDFLLQTLSGETANFVSLYDPIINVGGNYAVGNYTGASLQVIAGGNITFGNVEINAIDPAIDPATPPFNSIVPAINPANPAFLLSSGGSITGTGDISTTLNTLIVAIFSGEDMNLTGDITAFGGSIFLNSNNDLTLTGRTDTSAFGVNSNAGTLNINADGNVTLNLDHIGRPTGTGAGSDVRIRGASVILDGGGGSRRIDSATFAGGRTGNTSITSTSTSGDITLRNNGTIFGDARGGSSSVGGDIELNSARDIRLSNYTLNSLYEGADRGGNTSLIANRNILIDSSSNIQTNSTRGGIPGFIRLESSNGNIEIAGEITATSRGHTEGAFGAINISAQKGSLLLNAATISTTADNVQADVNNPGFAGDVVLNAGQAVAITNGSTISSDGHFGIILIGDFQTESVLVSDSTVSTNNQIINGIRRSGNINIRAQDAIALNGSRFSANTVGDGFGGSIQVVDANVLILNNSRFETGTTGSGFAGDILVSDVDAFVMRNNSLLLADAGGNADGGNIFINTGFLVGVPGENSDIIANAVEGNGGRVAVNANSVLGFTRRSGFDTAELLANTTNDLSASSQTGIDGEVELNTLDVDPSSGLTELPTDLTDRASQIAPGCGLGNTNDQSAFVITGRGGLPPNPRDPIAATGVNVPWVTADGDAPTPETVLNPADQPAPLVEAQGMVVDAEGNVFFVADIAATPGQPSGLPDRTRCALTVVPL